MHPNNEQHILPATQDSIKAKVEHYTEFDPEKKKWIYKTRKVEEPRFVASRFVQEARKRLEDLLKKKEDEFYQRREGETKQRISQESKIIPFNQSSMSHMSDPTQYSGPSQERTIGKELIG